MLVSSLIITSCKEDETSPDPNAGKTDPSTIAPTNLVAYFPFEDNGTDKISAITPSNTATTTGTFATGRRGKAFQGATDKNSGLLYTLPTDSKLKTLKAFSFSVWLKQIPNTLETTDAPEQMVFHLDGKGDWIWGNLFLLQHRNWPEGATEKEQNYAEMDCYFWKDDAIAWKGQRGSGWYVDVTAPQWRLITCTYDNVTSTFHSYVNGVHVTAFDGTEYMGVNRWQADGETTPLGDLKFNSPEKFAIGAWCDRLAGTALEADAWASPFKGLIDELRIYDRALTDTEVKALYDAEITWVE
ncbi:MAG: LamG domain-containing protein [Salinivirgaceae bacterium]|nr:LamG domain-containing protein [Salinivirgaceae bacterium]